MADDHIESASTSVDDTEEVVAFEQGSSSGKTRTYAIVGGVALTAVIGLWGLSALMASDEEQVKIDVRREAVLGNAPAATGNESPAYKEEVMKFNDRVTSEKGDELEHPIPLVEERIAVDVIPADKALSDYGLVSITGVDGNDMLPKDQPAEDVATPDRVVQVERRKQEDPVLDDLLIVMDRLGYEPGLEVLKPRSEEVEGAAADLTDQQLGSAALASASMTEQQTGGSEGAVVADATTLVYAVTNIALNTDYQGPVWMTVVGSYQKWPELSGASLLGEMVNLGEKVRLELKTMKLQDGRTLKINAIALDPETTYAAVSSDVDHHYLYRYGWWGVGTLMGAIGKAVESSSSTIAVDDGTVISSSTLDGTEEVLVAAGELGSELSKTFQDRLSRPVTVHIGQGEPLGVFFLDDVLDSNN